MLHAWAVGVSSVFQMISSINKLYYLQEDAGFVLLQKIKMKIKVKLFED